ncbi:response regulator [Paradesulfitobacterium ferrireducens]|uniref:response regulator n=1 Tax=Paradesulfitobacterium ferrireducens TaxID=2816476 RepID=UPI001A902A8B|nr:response regulator [Paradesulfitobacterium ferrireducens]
MRRIAIVEDFPAIRKLYKNALEPMEAEIYEYASGSSAVQEIASFHPDLLILDHRLPDMHGFSILEQVPEMQKIPVLVISGYLESEYLPHYQALGVTRILSKPIKIETLVEQVSSLLETNEH